MIYSIESVKTVFSIYCECEMNCKNEHTDSPVQFSVVMVPFVLKVLSQYPRWHCDSWYESRYYTWVSV